MKKLALLTIAALLSASVPALAGKVALITWPGTASAVKPPLKAAPQQKRAVAPGLSSVRVYAVYSAGTNSWEYPAIGQISSTRDHSGQVNIAVYERGYGSNSPVVKYRGATISKGSNYTNTAICGESGATLYSCSSGQTVIGWLKYWSLPSSTGGSFTYSNTSLSGTSPTYGTRSLSFTVR